MGCFPKPFWKYNGKESSCDSSLCVVGTFPDILIFSPSQDEGMPSHVPEEGPWEMQELDALLMAHCPGWPFPGTASILAKNLCLHRQPLCRKDVPACRRYNLSVRDLWVWGRVSTMRSDFFYHCPAEGNYLLGAFSSLVLPFSPYDLFYYFGKVLYSFVLFCFFALLVWPVKEDLEVNPSVEGSCLSFNFLASWRGCVSSASLALLSVILSDPFCRQRRKAVKRDRSGYK